MKLEVSRTINAAPEHVWAVLIDVQRWPGWTPSMKSLEYVEGSVLAPGARIRIAQPRLPAAVWQVTRVDPGSYFEWQASGPGMYAVAGHRVVPAGAGQSVVTLTIEQTGLATLLLGWWLKSLTERYVNLEANGLKAECEKQASH
jgi:uncharacterized protein YndB with AHSA1/START domain